MGPKAGLFTVSVVLAFAFVLLSGCGSKGLLYGVAPASITIYPNGGQASALARLTYSITSRASLSVKLVGPDGQVYKLRDDVLRAPDTYEIKFNGAVAVDGTDDIRVLPDGRYTMIVQATDVQGNQAEQQVEVNIQDADPTPLQIGNVVVQPQKFSPNNDGDEDSTHFSYNISKKASTQIYVTDDDGRFHLLSPEKERDAGEQSFEWDGSENGGRRLPDGDYTYHIKAWDKSGNVTIVEGPATLAGGGTPRLEIMSAKFTPNSIPLGGKVQVRIKVKNVGDTTVRSDPKWGVGPVPGTAYRTDTNYAYWRDNEGNPLYYERPGTWRVGVSWTNAPTPPPFPVRWSLGKDLEPGEEVEITGEITVLQKTRELYFWASLVQEGVGYVGDYKGQTRVIVSYSP
ncbi:MAG: hypothetical protein HYY30_03745 [Chloroflexi bacterium]|nr:hypothetical protein [Chloroflexota bacterium]